MKRILFAMTLVGLLFTAVWAGAETLLLPADTKTIGDEAFYEDTSLDKVVLPEGVTSIGSRAFANSSLKAINIPASVTFLADDAFSGITHPIDIELGDTDYLWDWQERIRLLDFSDSDYIYHRGRYGLYIEAYIGNPKAKDLRIPEEVRGMPVIGISANAFSCQTELTGTLSIPDAVYMIGDHAFFACNRLTGALKLPSRLNYIGDNAFDGCNGFTGELTIPGNVLIIGESAFEGCTGFTGTLRIPPSLKELYNRSFLGCRFDEVVFAEGVEKIWSKSFAQTAVRKLTLPGTVDTIWEDAFENTPIMAVSAKEGTYAYDWAVENHYSIGELPETGRDNQWNIQVLVCKNAKIGNWQASFTDSQVDHIHSVVSSLGDVFHQLSAGRMEIDNLYFRVIEEPLTSLSESYYLAPTFSQNGDLNIAPYIAGEDIQLTVVFAPIGSYPRPEGHGWLGLGGDYVYVNGRRVYTVTICDDLVYPVGEWTDEGYTYPIEINTLTHEMLHAVETNSRFNGFSDFQGLHDGEENGYDSAGIGWLDWQRDLMRDTIRTGNPGFQEISFYVEHY